MSEVDELTLAPLTFLTVGAVGPPGRRAFYLQGADAERLVTVAIVKEQAQALADVVARLSSDMRLVAAKLLGKAKAGGGSADLRQPIEPAFHAAEIKLSADFDREQFVLVLSAEPEPESPTRSVRLVASLEQMLDLGQRAVAVVRAGRPNCPTCGRPIDPDGHLCSRKNGHHKRQD